MNVTWHSSWHGLFSRKGGCDDWHRSGTSYGWNKSNYIYWTRIGNTNMIHDKLFLPPNMLGVKFENYVCFHVLHYPEAGLPHWKKILWPIDLCQSLAAKGRKEEQTWTATRHRGQSTPSDSKSAQPQIQDNDYHWPSAPWPRIEVRKEYGYPSHIRVISQERPNRLRRTAFRAK